MSNATTWTDEMTAAPTAERGPGVGRALVLSALILVTTAGLIDACYLSEKRILRERAVEIELRGGLGASEANFALLQRVDQIALTLAGVAAVGGVGCLIPLAFAATSWRRRVLAQWRQKAEEWHMLAAGLQNQLNEARRTRDTVLVSQSSLEERFRSVSTENARLQEELDKRNRMERALTQRRQELESSKSVLELHVQARTEQLENLQRRYELILNSAGEGICGLDEEGKTTFVNPTVAKLTGWPVEELIGKTEQEIFLGAAGNGKPALDGHDPGEQVFYRKDGTCFPVEIIRTPIQENDRVVGSVLMFKDITERKRTEQTLAQKAAELSRSNSELEQFAFVASHDLQEPLRKIQAFGDRLKVKCESFQSPEIRDYLERMQGAAGRMRTLINDLLAFSRVIRSSEPFVPVDLTEITKEVLGDLEVRIEKSGARIELGNLPTVDADPMQMRQLMLNLISNALKFQPPGGKPVVHIDSRFVTVLSGEQLFEIAVRDNGIGFDEKYVDRIFAVFQRLHGRGEYEGTGVGLAVCRRIVDRHHGAIIAKSKLGEGASFFVTLPVHHAQPKITQ